MTGNYVVGVTSISYLGFGVIIKVVSKEDNTYCVITGDIPQYMCLDFTKMSYGALCKKGNGCIANTYTMCSNLFAKWISTTTSAFMLLCAHTTRSCILLDLPVWLHPSSIVNMLVKLLLMNVIA